MEAFSKFFLGITLPSQLETAWEKWRRKFKAPRTKIHLTLIPPFNWEGSLDDLLCVVGDAVTKTKPFVISGGDVGFFGTGVIFIKVDLTNQLHTLRKNLVQSLQVQGVSLETRPYHPHITLASRLEPPRFYRYLKELESFSPCYSFNCTAVTLFQLTETNGWQKAQSIRLV